jgi:hypothetical protein
VGENTDAAARDSIFLRWRWRCCWLPHPAAQCFPIPIIDFALGGAVGVWEKASGGLYKEVASRFEIFKRKY